MKRNGFTLIEFCVVVTIIGALSAIGVPNFIRLTDNAREASTKSNMVHFQELTEMFAVDNNGLYPKAAKECLGGILTAGPSAMEPVDNVTGPFLPNPWSGTDGEGDSWESRETAGADPSPTKGIVSFHGDRVSYDIKGQGAHHPLAIVLTSGN